MNALPIFSRIWLGLGALLAGPGALASYLTRQLGTENAWATLTERGFLIVLTYSLLSLIFAALLSLFSFFKFKNEKELKWFVCSIALGLFWPFYLLLGFPPFTAH